MLDADKDDRIDADDGKYKTVRQYHLYPSNHLHLRPFVDEQTSYEKNYVLPANNLHRVYLPSLTRRQETR
jgi:hypothetical protein